MSARDNLSVVWKLLVALVAVLLLAGDALAYVGPAPGPEFFGYFATLLAWAGVAFSALLLWPIHALRQRLRGVKTAAAPLPVAATVDAPTEGVAAAP